MIGARLISESMFIGVSPLVCADSTPRSSRPRRSARPRDRPAVPNFFGDASHRVSERQRSPLDGIPDRSGTRLNSSHLGTSYAGFCSKKKKKKINKKKN